MISVLVLGFSTASGQSPASSDIVRTLAALVPGTVEGIFRDVTLLSTESNVDLAKVADHAGCALVEAATFQKAVVAGAARARCEVLLILPAGVTFDRSLSDEIAAAASQPDEAMDLAFRLQSVDAGVLGRLVPTTIPSVGLPGLPVPPSERDGRHLPGIGSRLPRLPLVQNAGVGRRIGRSPSGAAASRCSSRRGMISTKLQGLYR